MGKKITLNSEYSAYKKAALAEIARLDKLVKQHEESHKRMEAEMYKAHAELRNVKRSVAISDMYKHLFERQIELTQILTLAIPRSASAQDAEKETA